MRLPTFIETFLSRTQVITFASVYFFYIIITHKKENYEKDCIDGAVFAVASMAASAQIYVGGSLGIGSSKANSNADNQTNFSIKPEVG